MDNGAAPFRDAALLYWDAGWRGILPIPAHSKKLILKGWTGHDGAVPSYADVMAWADDSTGNGNIALRLPRDVLGIDVDAYKDKQGRETFADLVQRGGPLPGTWLSSARRDDTVSGIRFYRIPTGLAWPGEAGPHVEIVQWSHRYAVVWPSIHPDTNTQYRWQNTGTRAVLAAGVPLITDLPDLPPRWVELLSLGEYNAQAKAEVVDSQVEQWILVHDCAGTCRMVRHAVTSASERMRHGSRHEALNKVTLEIIRLSESGHRGLRIALDDVFRMFRLLADDRSDSEAVGEWRRAVSGALALVLGSAPRGGADLAPCSCDEDVRDLLPPAAAPGSVPTAEPASGLTAPAQRPDEALVLDGPLPSTPQLSALDVEIDRVRLRRTASRFVDAEEAAASFRPPEWMVTLSEELALPRREIKYTIPEVMPRGANVLLTAQFKAGKTTLINNVAKALADETPFLGKFQPLADVGRIALFNYEVDRQMYADWLRDARIVNTERITTLPLRGYRLPLTSPSVENWVVEWLIAAHVKVWIVDPFARAFVGSGDNENDNMQVGRFLDSLDVIKMRASVDALILATHTGRAEMAEGQEHSRGATRLDDWADARWMLTLDADDRRYFRADGRDVEFAETALHYDWSDRSLSIGTGGSRASARFTQVTEAIQLAVRSQPGIGTRDLREVVREIVGTCGNDTISKALGTLKNKNLVRVSQDGSATRHYPTNPTEALGDLLPSLD